jgi:hypothetical protein
MMLMFLDSFWEVAPTPQDYIYNMLSPWEVILGNFLVCLKMDGISWFMAMKKWMKSALKFVLHE